MKNIIISICLISISLLNAQSADEIINNYIGKTGGYVNWKKIESIKYIKMIENKSYVDSIVTIRLKNGKQIEKDIMFEKELISFAFDGNIAWNFLSERMGLKKLSEDETEKLRLEKEDFPNPFIDYKKKGFEIELLGKENINENSCFVIQLTKNTLFINGQVEDNIDFYYFDTKNFLPILIVSEEKIGLARGKIKQEYLSDYKKVGDLLFPFRIEQKYKDTSLQSVTLVKSIELNPNIDERMFDYNPKQ
ncbi:outer membrane lipoprotein-sorting protein [Mariniflexile sp.]|uniref:outer membrane lipoprotein-sorting protein n=1 Tax=Mariniflexile sp. TaxID=1979402 RepID=UPI00404852C0